MDFNYISTIKPEDFQNNVDDYLNDINVTVPAMIKQVLVQLDYHDYFNSFYLV